MLLFFMGSWVPAPIRSSMFFGAPIDSQTLSDGLARRDGESGERQARERAEDCRNQRVWFAVSLIDVRAGDGARRARLRR